MPDMQAIADAITAHGFKAFTLGYPGPTDIQVEAAGCGFIMLACSFNRQDGWEAVWENPDPDSDEQVSLFDGPIASTATVAEVAWWAANLARDWRAAAV